MSKTFSLLVILLLVSNAVFGVKLLKPGDVVKGHKIDKFYFCYDEAEQASVTEKLDRLRNAEALIAIQQEEIDIMKKRLTSVEETNVQLQKMISEMRDMVKQSNTRNELLAKEIESQGKIIRKERANSKLRQITGTVIGVAAILGGKYIATSN